jgi:AcrR family transcriptional regulator
MAQRTRLSREAWASAALRALTDGGLSAVAVEPLATSLGATKGSFYWHFRDRAELVGAALQLWESEQTGEVIAGLAEVGDPGERLRALMDLVITHPGERDPVVPLLRDADDPQVAAALRRVTSWRIGYVADELVATGMEPVEARSRAAMAVAAYVGWWQLHALLPDDAPVGPAGRRHADVLRAIIEAPLS